jgi:hypothetical protein
MTSAPLDDAVAVIDLADELQVRKQRLFKIITKLSIRTAQRRDPDRGNQNIATVSLAEANAIRDELAKSARASGYGGALPPDDAGFFYLIQLEPTHDAGRFKVGFTTDLDGRLQKHRCSAPFARYHKNWPCQRVWERAAIDCATDRCEQLHTEVFRAPILDTVAARADSFFALMPRVQFERDDDPVDPLPAVPAP